MQHWAKLFRRIMRWACAVHVTCLILFLFAPQLRAGNFGFRHNIELSSRVPASGLHWISIPYSYTPADSNTNTLVDAEDLVQDLQPSTLTQSCTEINGNCAVFRVWRWDETTGEYLWWTGGADSGTPFTIEPGAAYALEMQEVEGDSIHSIDIVGAHDPAIGFDDCHTPDGINMRWISIPPHLDIETSYGNPDVLDAEDLGQALGGPDHIFQIRRLNPATGYYENWVVGSVYGMPFQIDLRYAYAVDISCSDLGAPCGSCPWTWTPTHY